MRISLGRPAGPGAEVEIGDDAETGDPAAGLLWARALKVAFQSGRMVPINRSQMSQDGMQWPRARVPAAAGDRRYWG